MASGGAVAAVVANTPINPDMPDLFLGCRMQGRFSQGYGSLGAGVEALAAFFHADAAHCYPAELGMELLRFGTVTPGAAQGAPL
jgi:hypothetical protein